MGMFNAVSGAFNGAVKGAAGAAKAGGNAAAFNRVRNGDNHTVGHTQRFLNSHGFSVGVDGIWGPQTAKALKQYLNGVKPRVAPKQVKRYVPPQATPAPQKAPNPKGKDNKGGGKGGNGSRPRAGGGQGPAPGKYPGPQKVAQSMVDAQYDPAINQLHNLLGDVANQDQFNQHQIHGYYGQMKNLDRTQQADQGEFTSRATHDVVNAIGNAAQLFGGSNAPAMQATADNAAGYLGAVGASQHDYLANMLPLLDAQAASGTANEQSAARAQQQNYQDQLAAQQHAKGQAYTSAYEQAVSDQAGRQQNQLALQEAQSLMPYKVQAAKYGAQSAKFGAQSARVGAKYANANEQAALAGKQAQIDHYRALTKQEMAAASKDIKDAKASGKTNVLAPGSTTANRIQDTLYKSMTNSTGKIVIPNPVMAQRALFQNAIQQGLIDKKGRALVPGAIRLLNSTLMMMYNRDSAWQNSYKWNGRTFVAKK
jgi:hypothetical protein